jgi:membrane-associated protease RseP (regulator of RpoE activity)
MFQDWRNVESCSAPTKIMRHAKLKTLFEVMEIRRVKVLVHWSVLIISAVILVSAVEEPLLALSVLAAYYGVILIHECGHMMAAQRKGCAVWSIELYPIWGITRFSEPSSQSDRCVIAWGGVVAQLIVAVPLVVWVETFGYTRYQALNALLAILGFFSLSVAVFNLLPIRPLDGSIAWTLLPSLLRCPHAKPARREPGWRSWR